MALLWWWWSFSSYFVGKMWPPPEKFTQRLLRWDSCYNGVSLFFTSALKRLFIPLASHFYHSSMSLSKWWRNERMMEMKRETFREESFFLLFSMYYLLFIYLKNHLDTHTHLCHSRTIWSRILPIKIQPYNNRMQDSFRLSRSTIFQVTKIQKSCILNIFCPSIKIDAKCTAENGKASLDGLRVSTQPVCSHIFLLLGLSLFVG